MTGSRLNDRERWKWADGYEGEYMVSSHGRFMSVPRDSEKGPSCGYILRQFKCNSGYLKVGIRGKNVSVHREVAKAFVPNPGNKEEVNHKDGNRLNNKAENLEWVTHSENAIHAYQVLGVKHVYVPHHVKLNASEVIAIYGAEGTASEIGRRFGVSDTMVRRIKTGKSWGRVTCQST